MSQENLHEGESQEAGEGKRVYTLITKDEKGRKHEVVIQKVKGDQYGSVIDAHPAPRKSR
jgi:hypothetical protein